MEAHIVQEHRNTIPKTDKKDCLLCSYTYQSDSDMMYRMMVDHWYKRCYQCKKVFSDRKQLKEHMIRESQSNLVEEETTDEDIDVSLDEKTLQRL